MASFNVVIVNKDNFEEEVIGSELPVIVDFWAAWCGPCMMVAPVIDELADEYEGVAKVCKVNVDEAHELAVRFNVLSIPTVISFYNGTETERIVGASNKEAFVAMIENMRAKEQEA